MLNVSKLSRQEMVRLKNASENLSKRMDRLERKLSEIYEAVTNLERSVGQVLRPNDRGAKGTLFPESMIKGENVSEIMRDPDRRPNPWAVSTAISLMDSRLYRRVISDSYETYKPTVEALKSRSDWMSTEEISGITGRRRNTESTYLNRLLNANLLDQKRQGKKTLYKLVDEKKLIRIFGKSKKH